MLENKKRWFRGRYGSKRGFIRTQWHRVLFLLGGYRQYRRVNWHEVDRLVFVCTGNICRSAFTEVVAKSRGLNAISCGVETKDGLPADMNAVEAALRKGQNLMHHKTQKISSFAVSDRDLFVAMEPWQAHAIEEKLGNNVHCTLLGLWGKSASPYIHDPYGNVPGYFDCCFDGLEKSVDGIINEIRKAKESKH